jgi:alkylation response protein AidB-like acyl-CoA dehydrogenase
MGHLDGPSLLAAARALEPLVLPARARFDEERQLPASLVQALGKAELFGMWLPRALGGAELPPLEFLAVIEELSRQDGSAGWCTVIPAGYGRLAGSMQPQAAREIFAAGQGIVAGTLNPTGKAVLALGGWRVTGRWSYGSFIAHSHWVLGNCVTETDPPGLRLCFFPRAEAEVIDLWHVGGLRGTGSNDYQVADVFVPDEHTVPLVGFQPPPVDPGLLYRVPMTTTFVACIATVALGIARAAIEALTEIAGAKTPMGSSGLLRDKVLSQVDRARAEALLRSGRAYLWDELGACWDDVLAGREVTIQRRAMVRLAACQATQNAIQATDLMYACGGGSSLFQGNRLERAFRDIHAAGQHLVVQPQSNLEPIGRVLFGLDPGLARF